METRAPLLSPDVLARIPGAVWGVALDPATALVVLDDGRRVRVSRSPSGEVWLDVQSTGASREPAAHTAVEPTDPPVDRTRSAVDPVYAGTERHGPLAAGATDPWTRVAREADHPGNVAGAVVARTSGTVLRVAVNRDDDVGADHTLAVVELMKMELEIRAPRAGRVTRVHVAAGDAIQKGSVLFEIE